MMSWALQDSQDARVCIVQFVLDFGTHIFYIENNRISFTHFTCQHAMHIYITVQYLATHLPIMGRIRIRPKRNKKLHLPYSTIAPSSSPSPSP